MCVQQKSSKKNYNSNQVTNPCTYTTLYHVISHFIQCFQCYLLCILCHQGTRPCNNPLTVLGQSWNCSAATEASVNICYSSQITSVWLCFLNCFSFPTTGRFSPGWPIVTVCMLLVCLPRSLLVVKQSLQI